MIELITEKSTILIECEPPDGSVFEYQGRRFVATENRRIWIEETVITPEQFDEIKEMIAQGMPQKEICARTGISDATVRGIQYGRKKRPTMRKPRKPIEFVEVKPYVCEGCRLKVKVRPCRLCYTRAKRGLRT